MDDDVMSAEEAQAWRDDGVDGNRDEIARLCDTIIALHQRADAAWLAGARAARAADVAEVRRLADRHSAEVRRYYAETSTASEQWLAHARCEGAAGAVLARAGNVLAALPLPAPPAPPQSPLPSPDGGTGPQGDGAPAGGLSVAVAGGDAGERLRALDLPGAARELAAWAGRP
jgi:hypothetical protein